MRPSIQDDTERSDDRLKYTKDGQATRSWIGHGENTHLHFTRAHVLVLCWTIFLSGPSFWERLHWLMAAKPCT